MIITGSNKPIIIEFTENMEDVDEIRITLWKDKEQLKLWTKDNISIKENVVACNLTQTETKAFPPCIAQLECKWLKKGEIEHSEKYQILISERNDLEEMGG